MSENAIKKIGSIDQKVIDLLKLDLKCGTPIYIGQTNIEHIKSRHPYEYDKYFGDVEKILERPDYIGLNPKDGSIAFVKEYQIDSEFVRVAVKVAATKRCYAKTLHLLSTCNAEHYIKKGTLIKLDNDK